MRSNLFRKEIQQKYFSPGDGAKMAACEDQFGPLALEDEETVLAIRLAEALRTDEVESFLEIYDSIPSTTDTKRIGEIKEMARQVAALPKKQFEMYRSKKILSNDHSFLWPGNSQAIKDKLNTNFISRTVISNVEKDLIVLQNQGDVLDFVGSAEALPADEHDAKPKTGKKKKKSKSKKRKSTNTVNSTEKPDSDSISSVTRKPSINSVESATGEPGIESAANGTGKPSHGNLEMKHKVLGLESCAPLSISMNTNLVADISTGQELEMGRNSKSSGMDLRSCGSSSSNDSGIVTPKELTMSDDIKEVDSGLGSYTSPVFPKEPPFGFPPSSQKLLESALGLLPNVALQKGNSSNVTETSENIKNLFQQSDKIILEQESNNSTPEIEDDPISDISDTKEVCKDFVVIEGDSVDGDVSSSSAVEDEGGWQSQTRRSHRRKKRELAARASREKNHMDRFQKKDFHKQQSDNQFRKSHHRRKSVEDKKNHSKALERVFQNTENKNSNDRLESSAVNSNTSGAMCAKSHNVKDSVLKAKKGLDVPSDSKISSQKEMSPTQKVLSYRDALLKAKGKAERTESSDSGVDANSVSSCELGNLQSEMQNDSFNKQQCVDYLRSAWKKVMSNAKQGLVIYFSVDSDPVLCEQKRKKLAGSNRATSSKAQ